MCARCRPFASTTRDGPILKDRRQEIVFIGQGLKQDALTKALDACLVREDELRRRGRSKSAGSDGWKLGLKYFEDPFPNWPTPDEYEHGH